MSVICSRILAQGDDSTITKYSYNLFKIFLSFDSLHNIHGSEILNFLIV